MYIFGYDLARTYNQGHVYLDLVKMEWNKLENTPPYKQILHTSNVIGNFLYLFGGFYKGYSNTLHVFDFEN